MEKISDLIVMDSLSKADSQKIRAFTTLTDVNAHPLGGIISFGVPPEIYPTIKNEWNNASNDNFYIAYMVGKKDYYEMKDKLQKQSSSNIDISKVNVPKLMNELKNWRKSTGCNASDEIVHYVLHYLTKSVDSGSEQK